MSLRDKAILLFFANVLFFFGSVVLILTAQTGRRAFMGFVCWVISSTAGILLYKLIDEHGDELRKD